MLGTATRATLHGARSLTLALLALALATTAILGFEELRQNALVRWALLLLLPMTVGGVATLYEPSPRSPRFPALVPMPTPTHVPLVLALLACDFGAVAAMLYVRWGEATAAAPTTSLRWSLALLLGGPAVVAATTLGWEWGLRQRLYGALAGIGRPLGGALLSVVAGTALALPAVAPGFRLPGTETLLALLAAAALREATALRLFRRAGILLSGSYRGAIATLEAVLAADVATLWFPAVRYAPHGAAGHALRLAGPLVALLVARAWTARLDRRDREQRLRP